MFDKKIFEEKLNRSFLVFEERLNSVRTGRASPAFLESVRVEAYGDKVPLKQVANISTLDNFTLSVKPFDAGLVTHIVSGIQNSGLGVNPIVEGSIMRVPLPKMTEERRKEMVEIVHQYGEDAKIAARNIRRDENDSIKKALKDKLISEDDEKRSEAEVQKIFEAISKKIEEFVKKKTEEVMHV